LNWVRVTGGSSTVLYLEPRTVKAKGGIFRLNSSGTGECFLDFCKDESLFSGFIFLRLCVTTLYHVFQCAMHCTEAETVGKGELRLVTGRDGARCSRVESAALIYAATILGVLANTKMAPNCRVQFSLMVEFSAINFFANTKTAPNCRVQFSWMVEFSSITSKTPLPGRKESRVTGSGQR
jgi:hypothetical protein